MKVQAIRDDIYGYRVTRLDSNHDEVDASVLLTQPTCVPTLLLLG